MPNTMTTTDTARHLIALHLGAESQHVDNVDADAALGKVLDAAHALCDAWDYLPERSDEAALRYAETVYRGSLAGMVASVLSA